MLLLFLLLVDLVRLGGHDSGLGMASDLRRWGLDTPNRRSPIGFLSDVLYVSLLLQGREGAPGSADIGLTGLRKRRLSVGDVKAIDGNGRLEQRLRRRELALADKLDFMGCEDDDSVVAS